MSGRRPNRNYKNYRQKKGYQKNRKNRPYSKTIDQVTGVPDSLRTKFTYVEQVLIQNASLPYNNYIFHGNSVYDPDSTGVGHQPRGFDEWSNFYKKYRVYASSIEVDFFQDQSAANGLVNTWILPTSEAPTSITYGIVSIGENPYSSTGTISPYVGTGTSKLKHYMTTAKMFGEKDINDNLYEGTMGNFGSGSNPPSLWYWVIGGETVDVTIPIKVRATVKVTYYVEMFDRVSLPGS